MFSLEYMNWTCLVYGGPMFLVMVWWFISARHWFKGPVVNVEHKMLGREGNVVEGKSGDRSSSESPPTTLKGKSDIMV
jgi:hypothetical protein